MNAARRHGLASIDVVRWAAGVPGRSRHFLERVYTGRTKDESGQHPLRGDVPTRRLLSMSA